MPIYRFDGKTPFKYIRSWSYTSHTWPAARDKAENSQVSDNGIFGAFYNGTYYDARQAFLQFDTSTIPDDEVITRAVLVLLGSSGQPDANQTVLAYAYDWGGSVTTADWRTRAQLLALPLFGSIGGAYCPTWVALHNLDPDPAAASLVNKTGYTRLLIAASDNVRADDDPPDEYSAGFGTGGTVADHQLIVVTEPAVKDTPQITPWTGHRSTAMVNPLTTGVGMFGAAAGDVGLIFGAYSSNAPTVPDGWTLIENPGSNILAWYKVLTQADVRATIVAITEGSNGTAALWVTGVDPSTPIGDSSSYAAPAPCSATVTIPSITQDKKDAFLVAFSGHTSSADDVISGWAAATDNPASWTELGDNNIAAGTVTSAIGIALRSAKTATGNITAAYSGSTSSIKEAGIAFFVNGVPGIEWGENSISIDAGAATTDDNDVTLTLSASVTVGGEAATVDQMCFSDDGVTYGDWEAYATSRAYQLPAQTDADPHTCTVYAKFRVTEDGEDYDSAAVSDSIDLEVGWTTSVAINAGAAVIFSPSVVLTISAASSAGAVLQMRFSDDGTTWSAWEAYATTRAYTLAGTTTGPSVNSTYYVVYVDFQDDDGNTTEDMDTAELTQGTIVYKDARTVSNVMPPVYPIA